MKDNLEAIAAAIAIFLFVVAATGWLWKKRKLVKKWVAGERAAITKISAEEEAKQLRVLREQVADRARAVGKSLIERSLGGGRVVNTDGEILTFIADFATYKRRLPSDPTRTFNGRTPPSLERRDRDWLEQWLADNPLNED